METIKRQTRAAYGCSVAGQSTTGLSYRLEPVRLLCLTVFQTKKNHEILQHQFCNTRLLAQAAQTCRQSILNAVTKQQR